MSKVLVVGATGNQGGAVTTAAIENGPASGAAAIKAGFQAVASGMDDVVLVAGVERMREVNNLDATDFVATFLERQRKMLRPG